MNFFFGKKIDLTELFGINPVVPAEPFFMCSELLLQDGISQILFAVNQGETRSGNLWLLDLREGL